MSGSTPARPTVALGDEGNEVGIASDPVEALPQPERKIAHIAVSAIALRTLIFLEIGFNTILTPV